MSELGPAQGLELEVVDEFVYTTLHNDVQLGDLLNAAYQGSNDPSNIEQVYGDTLPPDVVYPYIFYQHSANADTMTTDSVIVMNRSLWIVKVVDRAETYQLAKPIYGRVHALLHRASGTVVDGQVLHCRRESRIHYPEITEAVSYRHLGGVYHFWV
jgi:hypothetical protein